MWHTCENCGATYVDECMRCKWLLRPHDAAAVQALIGRKVLGLRISDDRSWLVFDTDSGLVVWGAWGGCCSDSWFADITGVDALLGGTVRSASEIRLDNYDLQSGSRDDAELAYGVKTVTERGYCDIVFRNNSSYYGGGLALRETLPTREYRDIEYTPITADWSA